jgi:hypothetical protein
MKKEFRYSPKVLFREGDKMRISGGPYYQGVSGKKYHMGVKGLYTFSHVDEDGHVWARSCAQGGNLRMVYMGEEKTSEETGTHFRPHKLVKVRKKK